MTREEMIAAVDQEIERLDAIRSLLVQSTSQRFVLPTADKEPGRRTMSPEARRRIGLAQKRRWANQKRGAENGRA